MKTTISITSDEYLEHCENDDGVCLACGEWKFGGVEPDAENYECEECGKHKVMGCEQALLCGHLETEDE